MEEMIVNDSSEIVTYNERIFREFLESKKRKPGTTKGLIPEDARQFRISTHDILRHCNQHNESYKAQRTHLVVGYVQSGKTMSFTGLTALAHDYGFRIVIILAGQTILLVNQTIERLEKDLEEPFDDDFTIIPVDELDEDHLSTTLGDPNTTVLIPILKHPTYITNVKKVLSSEKVKNALKGETVLIIDDEADQASLNGKGYKNSKGGKTGTLPADQTPTYEKIYSLRQSLPGNSYVQYTATPQANILIPLIDILSPQSHTVLEPGNGYTGGKTYFGEQGKYPGKYNNQLILDIPENEIYVFNSDAKKTSMPKTLKYALKNHILSICVLLERKDANWPEFLSMLIHADRQIATHKMFEKWIQEELTKLDERFKLPEEDSDRALITKQFKKVYEEETSKHLDSPPSFDDIKSFIPQVLQKRRVILLTGDSKSKKGGGTPAIKWKKSKKMYILIGGEMLGRGFTVENLSTTYMPRYNKGTSNADTIEQRCRFFGYKQSYLPICRVFLPKQSVANYQNYVIMEEEMRDALKQCDTLSAAGHKFMTFPRLSATRKNVQSSEVVTQHLKGTQSILAVDNINMVINNVKIVSDFLKQHRAQLKQVVIAGKTYHNSFEISATEAIDFLMDIKTHSEVEKKTALIRFYNYLARNRNVKFEIIEMRPNYIGHRSGYKIGTQDKVELFVGKDDKFDPNYPGDRYLGNLDRFKDKILILLYHMRFNEKDDSLKPGTHAYSLGFSTPLNLTTNYTGYLKENDEYED